MRAVKGDGGLDVCEALTGVLDETLAAMLPAELFASVSVVAVGGYGRREQCLFSDVDVLLLYEGADPELAVRHVLYPLWDANLKVGHAVRTVGECIATAKESFETLTALLTARLVAGSPLLLDRLHSGLARFLRGRPLTPRLVALERERRDLEPYPVMAADLKEGRGALRTFHSFDWERRRAELLGLKPPHEASQEENAAHRDLLRVRNALHAAAGRADDVFSSDLRPAAARWLGLDVHQLSSAVTRALRLGDRLALRRWPDLSVEPARGRQLVRRKRRPTITPQRVLPMAVAAARRPGALILETAERELVAAAGTHEWEESDRRALLDLLRTGDRGRHIFGLLDDLGWVEANLPELSHTIAAPQIAPFHEHPVDTHLWRTADEMRTLIEGSDPWFSAIAAEVGDDDLLLIAAFVHDVGKARDGDHSIVGADLADRLCRRIGLEEMAGDAATLVREHLTLMSAATKRDTSDPRVIAELAATCRDLRTLQMLYLLAVADARATGRTMWTAWKAILLKNLYVRIAEYFETGSEGPLTRSRDIATTIGLDASQLERHIGAMEPGYLEAHAHDEVGQHVVLSAEARAGKSKVALLDQKAAAPRLVVVAPDAAGLLEAITGVLTMRNLEILDARLYTRADGIACDTFHVQSALPAGVVADDLASVLEADIGAVLGGDLDVAAAVAEKQAAYRRTGSGDVIVRAPTDPSLRYTPVEVRCPDRIGVLYDIVSELHAADLDIRAARIDTRAGQARDLFYVWRGGEPIRDVNELQPLIADLRRALRRRL